MPYFVIFVELQLLFLITIIVIPQTKYNFHIINAVVIKEKVYLAATSSNSVMSPHRSRRQPNMMPFAMNGVFPVLGRLSPPLPPPPNSDLEIVSQKRAWLSYFTAKWKTQFPFTSNTDENQFGQSFHESRSKSCKNLFEQHNDEFRKKHLDVSQEIRECGVLTGGTRVKRMPLFDKLTNCWKHNAKVRDHPWSIFIVINYSVAVTYKLPTQHLALQTELIYFKHSGTGSVIHRNFVLTAAHVLPESDVQDMQALLEIRRGELYETKHADLRKSFDLPSGAKICSVKLGSTYNIQVYFGKFIINPDTGEVIDNGRATKKVTLNNENLNYTRYFPGFANYDLGLKNADKSTNSGDLGLIFLGRNFDLQYNSIIRPICLPGFDGAAKSYRTCAPYENEEFIMAGYGISQDFLTREEFQIIKYAAGLNQARFKIRDIILKYGHFPEAKFIGVVSVNQQFQEAAIIGSSSRDSGAACEFSRYDPARKKHVKMQLAVHTRGNQNMKVSGTYLIFYTKWIVDAMLDLWTGN